MIPNKINKTNNTNNTNSVVGINKQSSATTKKAVAEVVFESLSDALFEKVSYFSLPYSDFGDYGTISTTALNLKSRIIDSSAGYLMSPEKESRFRCQFYLKNPSSLFGYLLSPAVFDSYDSGEITTNLNPLRSYVGLKFENSNVYIVVKEAGKEEKTKTIDFNLTMFDSTFTDTFALEIDYHGGSTEIKIQGVSYGTFTTDLIGSFSSVKTFYPFLSAGLSTDGTRVNIVAEILQFIQRK